jgi:nucleotide-binding universal stress UspA family protein
MKVIIAATDGSQGAERAISAAADLTKAVDGRLLLVNVGQSGLSQRQLRTIGRLQLTEGDALEGISDRILAKANALARARGAAKVETMSCAGDPAEALIKVAKDAHADALVVGRRGLGQLKGLLLGSVSQKLASLAPCMAIIVP